ncbi:hypothetical protein FACS1894201_11600 [Bacteroidia bacterium]|nr:hypothetical protein FACS1894201_11600 [Bacteroidia bacterium]
MWHYVVLVRDFLAKNITLIGMLSVLLCAMLIEGLTGLPLVKSVAFAVGVCLIIVILGIRLWLLYGKPAPRLTKLGNVLLLLGIILTLLYWVVSAVNKITLTMTLLPEQAQTIAFERSSAKAYRLPFTVMVRNFEIEYYENGQTVKAYRAVVEIQDSAEHRTALVRVNHPMHYHSYDLYLESYQNPTVQLLVVYDNFKYGVYSGIILIFFGFLLFIFSFLDKKKHP